MFRRPSLTVLIALVAGLVAGMLINAPRLLDLLTPIGVLWTNALRMPIIPLVVALIITGIARGSSGHDAGGITVRALVLFVIILVILAALMVPITPWLLSGIRLDPAAIASLKNSISFDSTAAARLTISEWFTSLIPTNPIKAAADGTFLPLVLFAMLYGLALTRMSDAVRLAQTALLDGIADVLIRLIRWVLLLAPLGIFALAFGLGARLGGAAATAMAQYVVVTSLVAIVVGALIWGVTVLVGRVTAKEFSAALLPALTIAFSSRSSLAALPVLIEGMRAHLRISERVSNVVLPLAASVFKLCAAPTWIIGALFVARIYGVDLSTAQVATFAVGSVLLSFTVPGIPSGGFLVQAPLYVLVGLPTEGLGLLIAVDLIPDLLKSAGNVTGFAAATVLVDRMDRGSGTRD